jgi:hypothetical protein
LCYDKLLHAFHVCLENAPTANRHRLAVGDTPAMLTFRVTTP